jgi:hypothetical protein
MKATSAKKKSQLNDEPREDEAAESEKSGKDIWDKIEIVGKGIVLPVVLAAATFAANWQLSSIIDMMKQFREIYHSKDGSEGRRFSVYFVRRIADPLVRNEIRNFIFWDVIERNVSGNSDFRFDEEKGDWHLLGDSIYDMSRDPAKFSLDGQDFKTWWLAAKQTVYGRFPNQKEELTKSFAWIGRTYLGER